MSGNQKLHIVSNCDYSGPGKTGVGEAEVKLLGDETGRWLTRAEMTKSRDTMRGYRYNLGRFVTYIGASADLGSVTDDDCVDWSLSTKLSGGSLKTAQAAPRAFFAAMVRKGLLARSPWDGVDAPRPAGPTYRGLDSDSIARLLHCGDLRERTIVLCGLHLGMRCIEMERMVRPDWDRPARVLVLRGKGGRVRAVPVSAEMGWAFDIWFGQRRLGPLFPSQSDPSAPIRNSTISAIFRRLAGRAEVNATAHQLRHTFAHNLIGLGVEAPMVQRLLGHASLDTTGRYLALPDRVVDAVDVRYLGEMRRAS